MRAVSIITITVINLLLLCPFGTLQAEIIDYLLINYPSISPNGDGIKDSSPVEVSLQDSCDLLTVTIEDLITTDVLATLLDTVNIDAGVYSTVWSGEDSFGTLLNEGSYTLHLIASKADTTEELFRTVILDLTTPVIQLERIEPGLYTPGIEGTPEKVTIYYLVSSSQEGDSISVTILDPSDSPDELPAQVTGDGSHTIEWSTTESAEDGLYTVSLYMEDEAGNKSSDTGNINVDTAAPTIEIRTKIDNENGDPPVINEIPPLMEGSCFDRNGVEEPHLVWNDGAPFSPDSTFWVADTLFWHFNIIDSVTTGGSYIEGTYTLDVLCSDLPGRTEEVGITFTIDITPPDRPVLNQPPSPVIDSELRVSGRAESQDTDRLIVYRVSGTDTTSYTKQPILPPMFDILIDLLEGRNEIWAEVEDDARNRSEPSDIVTVTFTPATDFVYPEVFRSSDFFRIYTEREARKVTVKIFTLNGEEVVTLKEAGPATKFEIPWNLRNDEGETVRNGAYLLLITVYYDQGKTVEKSFIAVVR